jgi:hypothetical protein
VYEGRTSADILAEHTLTGSYSATAAREGSRPTRAKRGPSGWCAACGQSAGTCCSFRADTFSECSPRAGFGLEAEAGRYFLLRTASLSALGYERDVSEPVIRFWDETPHVARIDPAQVPGYREKSWR